MSSRKVAAIIGRTLLAGLWLLAFVMAGATALEFVFKIRDNQHGKATEKSRPRFSALELAYDPFAVQYLHPQYLFFFPLDPRARVALSNERCTIDADGFRGPGPSHAGGRRLAFLLGGSAAFGWYASSDQTTITGYLNRMQDQYFFVNAGVASWNSTQELFRLAFQLMDYHPALVVTYDGSNDRSMMEDYFAKGIRYPAGTADHFDVLSSLVDNRDLSDPGDGHYSTGGFLRWLFPYLTYRLRVTWAARSDTPLRVPDDVLQDAVARYLSNLARMNEMVTASGARFIATYQPVGQLHRNFHSTVPFDPSEGAIRFHQAVLDRHARDFEFHDLGNLFDRYYQDIPVMGQDVADDTIFVDEVHVYDPGNEVVARHLATLLVK